MEMLRTADAAEITQTGGAYLQVGNNEVYELFQTAWSGADYQPEKDQLGIEDHTIYLINELGQYEVLNQDLSGLDMAEEIKEVPTELDVIVQEINHLHQQEGIAAVAQPWLPPLKERITLDELDKVVPIEAWQKRTAPSPDRGRRYPASAKARSSRYRSVKRWEYPPLRKSRYRKDHFPPDCRYGFSSQTESRKSDHVPAGFWNQWSSTLDSIATCG